MKKRSNSEVGHAKNVAGLGELIARCGGFNRAYDPPRPELSIASLQQLQQEARDSLKGVQDTKAQLDNAKNYRRILFRDLPSLATRIVNMLAASGVTPETLDDARGAQRKISGTRASKKPATPTAEPESTPVAGDTETQEAPAVVATPTTRSSSQQSYDLKIEHFASLLALLEIEPLYTPKEPDLQLSALQTHLENLRMANNTLISAETAVENARRHRDEVLYDKENGVVARGHQVKMYVKAVYGATSAQYKQINRISFRTRG